MVYIFSLCVIVAGTPTGLTATRLNTGLTHVQLSWSSVSGVAGYEVFYQLSSGSSSVMSAGTTTNTMLNITSGLTSYNLITLYIFTGIDPGTYCIVGLYGIYGSEPAVGLGSSITTTLSSGKLYYIHNISLSQLLYCSHIIYSTHFICQ